MIEIGKLQKLRVADIAKAVYFLEELDGGKSYEKVIIEKKDVDRNLEKGEVLEVFVYVDSKDRLAGSFKTPLAQVGEVAYLKVVEVTKIGAFLDIGIEKDLFLPFKEQKFKVQEGKKYLVVPYVDKTGRLACTTYISKHLSTKSPYKAGDKVKCTAIGVNKDIGVFVAVDNKYEGLISKNEYFSNIKNGDQIEARVISVKPDGKLDLSPREVAHKQMDADAELILKEIDREDGYLELNDKSSPKEIKEVLGMSKSAFKRSVGRLLKQGRVEFYENGIVRK